ncbi:YihY/virulence factor BrkB family protein [Clostridium aestuarii]|uniref:YihY/virulence factor BrkB family protein n=1 Tax=Clostridium aestuarii TaxID=338193 RepID=A0ABT4CZU6_9CLOT|nr:YihY/virulence factor BrkB family protein [Clostridium aestuarii]MCY6484498.1 YihY/virulence factor BrkB family protein [Clostridium aestuarii]
MKKQNKYLLLRLIYKTKEDDIFALGSQLAYSLLLSFFPFLIFLMTMIGFSSVTSNDVLLSLRRIMPSNAFELIYATVIEIFDSRKSDLLSFSLIITIFIASNGFTAVINALNKAYDMNENRSFWEVYLTAILCTFILAFMIMFSLFLLVLGNLIGITISTTFNLPSTFDFVWDLLRYFITLMSMIFIFAIIYKLTPARKLKFVEVLPGSIFATIGWLIASMCFAFYVDNFNNYSKLYGGIGAVIVLLIWLFLTSVIILIGGEINSLLIES